jgi:hypothetical protein
MHLSINIHYLQEQLQILHSRTKNKTVDTADVITDTLLCIYMSWLSFFHFVPRLQAAHKPSLIITMATLVMTSLKTPVVSQL